MSLTVSDVVVSMNLFLLFVSGEQRRCPLSWAPPPGGTRPPGSEFLGGRPPETAVFKDVFLELTKFQIFQDFHNKVTEIPEEIRIWGWRV